METDIEKPLDSHLENLLEPVKISDEVCSKSKHGEINLRVSNPNNEDDLLVIDDNGENTSEKYNTILDGKEIDNKETNITALTIEVDDIDTKSEVDLNNTILDEEKTDGKKDYITTLTIKVNAVDQKSELNSNNMIFEEDTDNKKTNIAALTIEADNVYIKPEVDLNNMVLDEEKTGERKTNTTKLTIQADVADNKSEVDLNNKPSALLDGMNEISKIEDSNKDENQIDEDCQPDSERFCGHKFDEDFVLRDEKGERFNYNVYKDHRTNQDRYERIGEDVNDYIYELLQTRCKMLRHFIPFEASDGEPLGFFFASENAETTEDKLLILIHGSGVVRAGQWARRIIINDNLMDGSQIPYIEQAYKEGYEVVVLNTNQNSVCGKYIRGSSGPEEHALYVWDNFIIKRVRAKHIAIMAHSYGGSVTFSLAEKRKESFLERMFAVAFSDSVHASRTLDKAVRKFFEEYARDWVASPRELDEKIDSYLFLPLFNSLKIHKVSAGHTRHEWTSATCMKSVFKFFNERLHEKNVNSACRNAKDSCVDKATHEFEEYYSKDVIFGNTESCHGGDYKKLDHEHVETISKSHAEKSEEIIKGKNEEVKDSSLLEILTDKTTDGSSETNFEKPGDKVNMGKGVTGNDEVTEK